MKSTSFFLSGMKSRYLVLLACLSLLVCTTSCNDDEFETVAPEGQRQYTKAELIEQALSRMPRTRVNGNGVRMITIKDSVEIKVRSTQNMTIYWDTENISNVTPDGEEYSHQFSDGNLSRVITLSGDAQALQSLNVNDNGLILLDIFSNVHLTELSCANNHLDDINLKGCPNLIRLDVSNNELSSLEVAMLPDLASLRANQNRLTALKLPEERKIYELFVENNQITELDLSDFSRLSELGVSNNPLKSLNLKNSTRLNWLYASFTRITNLDLSDVTNLWTLLLNDVPIDSINNQPINSKSFSYFTELDELDIANTPFTELDLSNNPVLCFLDISGTAITELDISDSNIEILNVSRSRLTDLIYGAELPNSLYELRIESTPFEKVSANISALGTALPERQGMSPGHLYTYSQYMNELLRYATTKNWLINQ